MPQVGYAGFWLRLVALLIDSVVLWFVFVPILAITGLGAGLLGAISSAGQSGDPSEVITAIFSTGFVGLIGLFFMGRWLYFALMECSTWQATLGKKALGLYVTDLAGERITFGRASGRYFRENNFRPDTIHRLHHGGIHRAEAGAARHDGGLPGAAKVVGREETLRAA